MYKIFSRKMKMLCTKYVQQNKPLVRSRLLSVTQDSTYTCLNHTVMIIRQKMDTLMSSIINSHGVI